MLVKVVPHVIDTIATDHLKTQEARPLGPMKLAVMTSSNGNIFRVTGPLCREFTVSRTRANEAELLMFSLICAWINGWINNREAGDLRRHRVHYDVIEIGPAFHNNGSGMAIVTEISQIVYACCPLQPKLTQSGANQDDDSSNEWFLCISWTYMYTDALHQCD